MKERERILKCINSKKLVTMCFKLCDNADSNDWDCGFCPIDPACSGRVYEDEETNIINWLESEVEE